MNKLSATLLLFLAQFPLIFIWLIGLALSLVYWRRHPKVSLLTLIGITGLLLTTLIGTYLRAWLPVALQERGWNSNQIGMAASTSSIISSLVSAVLWGLLLAAIFGWRGQQEKHSQDNT